MASTSFECVATRSTAAAMMNITYYLSLAVSLGGSMALV